MFCYLKTHYYNLQNDVIPSLKPIPNKVYHDKIKIGITYYVPENKNTLFINGIRQNALYFCELLLNIGYDCYLIVDKKDGYDASLFYDSRFKTTLDTNVLIENFDIVIMIGQKLNNDVIKQLQESKNTEKLSACIQTIKEVTKTCNNPQILQLLKN